MRARKGKVRWGALTAALTTLVGAVVAVVQDPAIIASAAGKLGISAVVLGAIVQAVTKPFARKEHER